MAFETEIWTYVGRRQGRKGLLAVFLDPSGEEVAYKMGKGVVHRAIGATYAIEVDRSAEGLSARLAGAKFEDSAPEGDSRLGEWETRDRAAYTTDELRKREAKAKAGADRFGSMSMEEVREAMRKLPYGQQTALLAQVNRYLFS